MVKYANIIIKKNWAYLNSVSSTTTKLGIATSPFLKIEWKNLSIHEKYECINNVFNGYKDNVVMPESQSEYSKYILEQFGFSSWKKLNQNSKQCAMEFNEESYIFTPLRYLPNHQGHEGIKDGIETVKAEEDEEKIIAALEKALEKSV